MAEKGPRVSIGPSGYLEPKRLRYISGRTNAYPRMYFRPRRTSQPLTGNSNFENRGVSVDRAVLVWSTLVQCQCFFPSLRSATSASQRSLHNEPIFRLLLKVAVKGTQQCEFHNFCGASRPNNNRVAASNYFLTAAR